MNDTLTIGQQPLYNDGICEFYIPMMLYVKFSFITLTTGTTISYLKRFLDFHKALEKIIIFVVHVLCL